jgi:hypothetical protein
VVLEDPSARRASTSQENSGSSPAEAFTVASKGRDACRAGRLDRNVEGVDDQSLGAAKVVVGDEDDFVDERDHARQRLRDRIRNCDCGCDRVRI